MSSPLVPRIDTLDGWRGVAILMVIANHATFLSRFNGSFWANLGSSGVDMFFVLSGYIITKRFLEERQKTSTIDLRSFYARRVFRILPLVCVYLLTICLLSLFVKLVQVHPSEILGSLFFFRNYQFAADPTGIYTMHFWSLSIEEHFYLLWPALFLWLGNRRALGFAVIGAVVCATWRLYDLAHPTSWVVRMLPNSDTYWRLRTDLRFDGLLLGCAVAILLTHHSVRTFIFHNFPKETPLIAAMLLALNIKRTDGLPSFITYTLVTVMLASTVIVQEGLIYKWLNSRLIVGIGTISYSAYIWQQLFLFRPSTGIFPLGKLSMFPLNLICVFGVSALSFYCIERPCIAHGKRLLARRSEQVTAADKPLTCA